MPFPKKTLSIAVLAACTLFLAFFIRDHYSEFAALSSLSIHCVILIGIAALLTFVVNGLFLKVLLAEFGIDMGLSEYFSISIVTSFGNIFLPMKGGAGFKAVYLKSKYNFDYSYFVASLTGNYLICFNITAVTALGGLVFFYAQTGDFSLAAAAVFFAIAAGTSQAIFFPPRKLGWIPLKWAREQANRILSGWHTVRKSRRAVLNLFALTLLNAVLGSAITWLEFAAFSMKDAFGNPIGLSQSVVFTAISNLSLILGITPAALGIRESLLMFTSEILGISPAQALAVSLLDRSVSFIVLAVFFLFASCHLKRRLRIKAAEA